MKAVVGVTQPAVYTVLVELRQQKWEQVLCVGGWRRGTANKNLVKL